MMMMMMMKVKVSLSLIKHHVMKVYGEWIFCHKILTSALDGGELIIIIIIIPVRLVYR
jgi:hypothetical protein